MDCSQIITIESGKRSGKACILRGLEQALAFAEGTANEGTYVVHIPAEIDVRAIRGRLSAAP
jgi:hypothetical protein